MCAVSSSAQITNYVQFKFSDFTTQPQRVRNLGVYPIGGPWTNGAGVIITRDRFTVNTGTNGSINVSNVYPGAYYSILTGTTTSTTNWFVFPHTNGASAMLNASDWTTNQSAAVPGYLSGVFWRKDGLVDGSGIFFTTNGSGVVQINATADSSATNFFINRTNGNGYGTILYSASGKKFISATELQAFDGASTSRTAADFNNRLLVKSDGVTASLDWQNLVLSGAWWINGANITNIANTNYVANTNGSGVGLHTFDSLRLGAGSQVTLSNAPNLGLGVYSGTTLKFSVQSAGDMAFNGIAYGDGSGLTNLNVGAGTNVVSTNVILAIASNNLPLHASATLGYQTNKITTNTIAGTTNYVRREGHDLVSGFATNTYARGSEGFSINAANMTFFQKALNSAATGSRKLRLMWFGDSTGGDSLQAHMNFFGSNYLYGAEPSPALTGTSAYFGFESGVNQMAAGASGNSTWWGDRLVISNLSSSMTFGIRNSFPIRADQLRLWYIAHAGHGTETVYTSPSSASNTWTLRATVDQTTGNAGVRATNISLTLDSYYIKISNSVAGTQSRTMLLWPQLEYSASNSASFFDGHVNGATVSAWVDMGEVSIASLLTNYAPDVIYWQQTKDVASYDYFTNAAIYFNRYASNSDIVLIQSQESFDPAVSSLPASGGQFQLPVARQIALTNAWTFIDNRTPFSDWTNSVIKQGLGSYGDIHFNSTGQLLSGQATLLQLGYAQRLLNSGLLKPIDTSGFARLRGGNYFGNDQVITNGTLYVTNPIYSGGSAAGLKFEDRDTTTDAGQWFMTGTGSSKKMRLAYDNFADTANVLYFSLPFGTPLKINSHNNFGTTLVGDESLYQFYAVSQVVSNNGAAVGLGGTNLFGLMVSNGPAVGYTFNTTTNGRNYAQNLTVGSVGGTPIYGIQKGVVALVTGTNRVTASFASVTNPILLTPHWRDSTNFWVGVSNIIEGASFDIVAVTNMGAGLPRVIPTTNTVGWMVVK